MSSVPIDVGTWAQPVDSLIAMLRLESPAFFNILELFIGCGSTNSLLNNNPYWFITQLTEKRSPSSS